MSFWKIALLVIVIYLFIFHLKNGRLPNWDTFGVKFT